MSAPTKNNFEIAQKVKKNPLSQLSTRRIDTLQPERKKFYVWHSTGRRNTGRVGIAVYPNGIKEFCFRSFSGGKSTITPLGQYPEITLEEAFSKAEFLGVVLHKKTSFSYMSISDLFDGYIKHLLATGRRAVGATRYRLNQVLKSKYIMPDLAANLVTTEMISRCLAEFIERGAIAGSNKVRSNLHAAFNYALHYDNDPANINKPKRYKLKSNPVTPIPKQRGAEKALDRFLSWGELKALIENLTNKNKCPIKSDYARLILLCIYSGGQRPYEIITMKNKNIDLVAKTMTITPENSKTVNFHVVPLSEEAISIIKTQQENYPNAKYLFHSPTKKPHLNTNVFAKHVRKYCKKTGCDSFTPRDLRRTFKTLAGALGVNLELRDILQNHKRQGTSARHYDRYQYLKEKQEIIKLWNDTLREL